MTVQSHIHYEVWFSLRKPSHIPVPYLLFGRKLESFSRILKSCISDFQNKNMTGSQLMTSYVTICVNYKQKRRHNLGQQIIRFLVTVRLQNWCGDALFNFFIFLKTCFLPTNEIRDSLHHNMCMYTWFLEPDHTQRMVAKRGLINRANVHTHLWKSRLKHSAAEFQSILDIVSYPPPKKKNRKEN